MFQLRSCLVTLHSGMHSVKIDILSILSVISYQKLTPTLLNPLGLTSLLIKLETQLVSHSRLALPQWNGENTWYMCKFIKLWSFMKSGTLYTILHTPLVDKSLEFHLFRIQNIPSLHPGLKKSFRYSIQEEFLTIRLDVQYITCPLSTDIMASQPSNSQFCHINSPLYVADTSNSYSYVLFLQNKDRIYKFCILLVISQTQDKAININDNFWAIFNP